MCDIFKDEQGCMEAKNISQAQMPLLQERVIAAFFLSLFLVFYGGKAMKIYVKESKVYQYKLCH